MSTAGASNATDHRVPDESNSVSRSSPSIAPSFKAVYRQHFDFVWASVRRFGVHPGATDDVVQEVFIVIHAKLDALERPEALRSWIYGVVRRVASNHRRALRTQLAAGIVVGTPYNESAESPDPTPLERMDTNADLAMLAGLLDELDEPKREVFALVEIDELTVREAADILEIPVNTAYSRLRTARQAFERAVARRRERSKGT